jgi:uncharacterized protein DUF1918
MTTASPKGQPGDVIVVEEHHLGEGRRACEVLEVLGTGSNERYRVRWDDGHESIFFPGNDAHFLRHESGGRLSHVPAGDEPDLEEGAR